MELILHNCILSFVELIFSILFIKEAELHSACPSGKQNGGSLGWFGRGMMVKEFEDAAFSMKPGDLSDVIETQFGYHIISVNDREDARQLEFEEVKAEAVNAATSIAKEMERSRFIEELKSKATIENLIEPHKELGQLWKTKY